MLGYVIVEIEVTDPDGYEEYRRLAGPIVAGFGGHVLVRGGNTQTLEGGWEPKRVVVLQFESVEQAKNWWHSEEYSAIKGLRYSTTNSRMIVVEGV